MLRSSGSPGPPEEGKIGSYNRSTRQCSFGELRPDLVATIQAHLKKYHLEGEETQALACIETTNVRAGEPGFFERWLGARRDTNVTTVIVTPRMVIWAFSDTQKLVFALSSRLADIEVKDYESTFDYKSRPDCGLELRGPSNDGPKKGAYFIGLGKEDAAEAFRLALKEAVQRARQGLAGGS